MTSDESHYYPTLPDDVGFTGVGPDVTMESEYFAGAGEDGDDLIRIVIRRGERSWEVLYSFVVIEEQRYLKSVEADEEVQVEVGEDGHVNLTLNVGPDEDA
jgi:hypothetical protein